MKLDLPRGMRDLDSEDYENLNHIRNIFLNTLSLFNFRILEPSPLEMLSTLETKSGTSISNEIYNFIDKGDRHIALRFDLTMGLTRYVVTHRELSMPSKLGSFAGVWRYDEPQSGRYRYFHQWDAEIYGSFNYEADAEIIEFTSTFFKKLGLDVIVNINDRQLVEQFIREDIGVNDELEILEMFRAADKIAKKSKDAIIKEYEHKLNTKKLERLLDLCSIYGDYDKVASSLNLSSTKRLENLIDSLHSRNINNFKVNLGIVRGLDYYSGYVFEVFDPSYELGAIVGGGRYDSLTKAFGRKDMGATGAAGGVERILLALKKHNLIKTDNKSLAYIVFVLEEHWKNVLNLSTQLREYGISVDYDLQKRSLSKQLKNAYDKSAKYIIIIQPELIINDKVLLKFTVDKTEVKININELHKYIK